MGGFMIDEMRIEGVEIDKPVRMFDILNAIHQEIRELRKDVHWMRTGSGGRIYDENGCCCEYYRTAGSYGAWECPAHGYLVAAKK